MQRYDEELVLCKFFRKKMQKKLCFKKCIKKLFELRGWNEEKVTKVTK